MDIAEFLAARLDEDARIAQAAGAYYDSTTGQVLPRPPASWHRDGVREDDCRIEGGNITIYDEGGHSSEQAEHIARHDPARVLADVAAKRVILFEHQPQNSDLFPEDGPQWCATCPDRDGWPCPTVRALAMAWADHPDFDPSWRVTVTA